MSTASMTTHPTTAQKREMVLAELRLERELERLRHEFIQAHVDFMGIGVKVGFIPPDSVPLMLAELYGTAEGAADE